MTVRSCRLETLLVCVATLVSRSGHAEPSPTEISSARRVFAAAVELENAARWGDAALKLREAVAVKDTPGLRFHLAHCETEQGLLVEAAADYERAAELIRNGAKALDVQKLLAPASAALEPRIPRLTVELPADAGEVVPMIDGKVVPPSELAFGHTVDPGPHEVLISASGRRTFRRSISLREGESANIAADLPRVPPVRSVVGATMSVRAPSSKGAENEAPVDAPRKRSSAKLFLLVGESVVTAAGLVIGLAYERVESSASDRITSAQGRIDDASRGDVTACGSPATGVSSACGDLSRAIDDHDRAATVSTVGFITAGVGAAAFITTWLAYPSQRVDSAHLTIQPFLGMGRAGLFGHF